ncbi:hypothetical protein C7974DRAFT_431087 [Boeremia exigua]|uniref:uncharacterized protein n=1 Tax=Boeremia exigua TaxID=749465 RepID=UPI001E8EEC4A|nr:uncharacterized protein C7974DRAFT_431087 [Boeremia exigua]KAH6642688.1 hypothetical protein C7974DRAFT_431087 [Boeremia exigua]
MDEGDEESLLNHDHAHRRSSTNTYEQMDSWVRLVKAGTIKLLMTIFFGGMLCVCLKAWEGFGSPIALTKYDIRIFNALTIAISICLGLNLLASLKRYAVILRWSILTRYWVPVEVFDLVLGIDELTNAAKLFVLSTPALEHKWLMGKSRPWKDAQPGTKWRFGTVCFIWLLINIGSQVLVASLSLFWPTEQYPCRLTTYGSVAVADLSKWSVDGPEKSNWTSQEAAWRYGMDAQSWSNFSASEPTPALAQLPGTPLYRGDGYYEYRFFYRNPQRLYGDFVESDASIQASAHCKSYEIHGNVTTKPRKKETDPSGSQILAGMPGEKPTNVSIPSYGRGMVSWIVLDEEVCGPRCSQITVFQARAEEGELAEAVDKHSLWVCENYITDIRKTTNGANHTEIRDKNMEINGTDIFARIGAGAIGWTGISQGRWTDRQFRYYTQGTPWSPPRILDKSDVEEIIMRFSIGAIAAFDDHGIRRNVTINNETCDDTSQKINVSWRYVSSILGAIGLIQFGALCYLLLRANRSIVRDASFFSTAMLLRPILEVLDDVPGRMAMSGAEIKNHKRLRNRNVRYDYKEVGHVKQVTVYFEDEFKGHMRKKWPSGDYSG